MPQAGPYAAAQSHGQRLPIGTDARSESVRRRGQTSPGIQRARASCPLPPPCRAGIIGKHGGWEAVAFQRSEGLRRASARGCSARSSAVRAFRCNTIGSNRYSRSAMALLVINPSASLCRRPTRSCHLDDCVSAFSTQVAAASWTLSTSVFTVSTCIFRVLWRQDTSTDTLLSAVIRSPNQHLDPRLFSARHSCHTRAARCSRGSFNK